MHTEHRDRSAWPDRGAARSTATAAALLGTLFGATSDGAAAQGLPQLTYSIDFSGPTIQAPGNAAGTPISDGDLLLRRGGPFNPELPLISLPAAFLDRYPLCSDHAPGDACGLEINAISFGRDAQLRLDANYRFHVLLSVDEWAVGRPAGAGFPFTTLFTEAQGLQAAGDIFLSSFTGAVPGGFRPNTGYADGDGQQAQGPRVFGLGLVEPINQTLGTTDDGDNVDAINYGSEFDSSVNELYFSLEGGGPRCNELGASFDAAAAQMLVNSTVPARAADVLIFRPTAGGVFAYARAQQLGLDLSGPGLDDIDALVVFDNGDGIYQPPANLYDWQAAGGSDLILFSVRCGSDVVGRIDPVSGRAIGEGDVLIKLAGTPGPPQVFIPAEALGLRSVEAGDTANDELNGLDIFDDDEEPFLDCNMNGIDDAIDITYMNSDDVDNNGIPDECEDDWDSICDCTLAANAPCGNTSTANRGCTNVTGVGGRLEGGGTTSISSDALQLVISDLQPGTFGVGFAGVSTTSSLVQNGRLCVVPLGANSRFGVTMAGAGGGFTQGPGLIATYPLAFPAMVGSSLFFQYYYRDNAGPCGGVGNFTNALRVTFTP